VDATFRVTAIKVDGSAELAVSDSGRWRPPRGHNRGRGTLLMQELMDGFEVSTSDAGTVVRLRRRLVDT
jgi:anti-sigma regulatory factor (Ser/Thr protein kinase)